MTERELLNENRRDYLTERLNYNEDYIGRSLIRLVEEVFSSVSLEGFLKKISGGFPEDGIELYGAVRRFESWEEFLKVPEILKLVKLIDKWNRDFREKLPSGSNFYERFSEATKTSIGRGLTETCFQNWVKEVLLYDIQSSFLKRHRNGLHTLEELDEFFWMVSNLKGLYSFDKISKAVTETWMARNIPVKYLGIEMFEAMDSSLEAFIESCELPKKQMKEFYEVVRKEYEERVPGKRPRSFHQR